MIKKIFTFLIFISITILISCKSTLTPPETKPKEQVDTLTFGESSYHQIKISQTDYQSFEIYSSEDFLLNSKKISSVILGYKNQGKFYEYDSLQSIYEQAGIYFRLKFNFFHIVSDTTLLFNFSIRYTFKDSSIYDVDTSLVTYKWPYKSTEIFLNWSEILISPEIDIQDFEILDSMIYFHPYGSAGMYQYEMKNHYTTLKIDYSGGDYLAVFQNYVFCDLDHHQIGRYNLTSQSLDLIKEIIPISQQDEINGMEVYNNKLYVSIENHNTITLDFNLQVMDSIPYINSSRWLAIKDSIYYSNNWGAIVRYNLNIQSYISTRKLPTSNCEAISIIGNKMFFTDYNKKIIGYFSLSDL